MNFPKPGDFIDIHNHGSVPVKGQFSIENLMAHEDRIPDDQPGLAYSFGIHPWHLTGGDCKQQLDNVVNYAVHPNVIALGEAGFDRLKGPPGELQRTTFEAQVRIADESSKPLFIHCVKAWEELISEHKRLKPKTKWIIHGFRGKKELAGQLISKGMSLSFWFDFVLRPESGELIKSLPGERIFLETDGSGVDIRTMYKKVASDLEISVERLKRLIYSNYKNIFGG